MGKHRWQFRSIKIQGEEQEQEQLRRGSLRREDPFVYIGISVSICIFFLCRTSVTMGVNHKQQFPLYLMTNTE